MIEALIPYRKQAPAPADIRELLDRSEVRTAPGQGVRSWDTGHFSPYTRIPQGQDLELYEQLVRTVPVLNGALGWYSALIGMPQVEAEDPVKQDLEAWLENVRVNGIQQGFSNWWQTWVTDTLTYGRAHAEMRLSRDLREVIGLQQLHTRTIDLQPAEGDDFNVRVSQRQPGRAQPAVLNPRLILTAVHDIRGDNPQGSSLFYGLPFVTNILTQMTDAVGKTWSRFGTPSFFVKWIPPDGFSDPQGTIGNQIAARVRTQLTAIMRGRLQGDIQDLSAAGNVMVEILGAAGQELAYEAPARAMLEQLLAKIGLPPFLFGFQWSTTERMSAVQAALITRRIDLVRACFFAELLYLLHFRQALSGGSHKFTLCWDAPTLIDEAETAKAMREQAEADAARLKYDKDLWKLGMLTPYDVVRRHRDEFEQKTDEEIGTALPDLSLTPPAEVSPFHQPGNVPGDSRRPQEDTSGPLPPSLTGRSLTYGSNGH